VYVDIQALQISLLGGRVFFRGVKYHGNNETILIHSGYVTWCYWLRNVRELDVGKEPESGAKRTSAESDNESPKTRNRPLGGIEEGGVTNLAKLPCRVNVSLNGLEWFVYNRSAAYDAVVAGMTGQDIVDAEGIPTPKTDKLNPDIRQRKRDKPKDPKKENGRSRDTLLDSGESGSSYKEKNSRDTQHDDTDLQNISTVRTVESQAVSQPSDSPEKSFILRLLPVHIDCNKAAVVLGNEFTKSVLITKVDRASGEIDATKSTNLDKYRQLFNFDFEHPVIQMKPNDDYKEDQTVAGLRIKRGVADQQVPQVVHVHSHSFWHRQRRAAWHTLQDIIPAFRTSVESLSSSHGPQETSTNNGPGSSGWQGLSRYLDENEQDEKARWSSIEYATVSTIVDSPAAYMSFYWDVVGTVRDGNVQPVTEYERESSNINGDLPPEYGIHMLFKGAIINYGPWADRQRADIQRVFFPSLCKDAIPTKNLVPGDPRVATEFKLYIEFDEETTLRVPIREESKNWKWTKQADDIGARQEGQKKNGTRARKKNSDKGNPGPEIRPFGWLDVKVAANSTVTYAMDMVAGRFRYSNNLKLDLPDIEVTTSVNHGLLFRSLGNLISCDLSNPLQWNGQRSWKFDIENDGLELFILREHVFLLIDLVNDWASGPPPEYLTFTPFQYQVNLILNNFRIYLNVNDSNIINNPSDFDDNTFIIIFGSTLNSDICIPIDRYRPHLNDITFNVSCKNGGLNLHVPPWNTQATFLNSTELATLSTLKIKGSYEYCATTSPSNTDTLLLDVYGDNPTAYFYGFVIRYFLKVKDNYFGDDIRFKTLEEYQDVLRAKREGNFEISSNQPPHKKSNDLDVILTVNADKSSVILPSSLYSAKNHICVEIATLAADLRFTNYYMDLEVVLDTLALSQGNEGDSMTSPTSSTSNTQLFIDGVNATGNRLFGLPPSEPTYVCNWDFGVGAITGECTTDFFNRLTSGGRAFAFSFDDDENALPAFATEVLHDVTFLRASVESIRVWMHVEEAAFFASTGTISVKFNDWAGSHYSQRLNLEVPDLHLGCVDAESASRHRSRNQHPVETHAFIRTTVSFVFINRKLGFAEDRQLQQEHIKRHDQRTHRANFLLHKHLLDDSMLVPVDPPAMCFPLMPLPILEEDPSRSEIESLASKKSSMHRKGHAIGRKTSFLSVSNSSHQSEKSIIRPRSSLIAAEGESFESRSRSMQVSLGPGHRIPLRDVSASTGRPSSFYSAVGENKGLPPSSVAFSSSYIAPYFPLEGVNPDPGELPEIRLDMDDEPLSRDNQLGLDDIHPDRVAEDSKHASFILELPDGISGFFNPQAVNSVAALIGALQPAVPDDIIDEIQIESMGQIFDLNKHKVTSGNVTDFSIRTRAINLRFLNSSIANSFEDPRQDVHDQYDISLSGLAITARSEILAMKTEIPEAERKSTSIHLSLSSAGVAAKERLRDISDPQAAVNGVVKDVVVWMASGQ
jgi:hypothetical protein